MTTKTQHDGDYNQRKRGPHDQWENSGRKKVKPSQKKHYQGSELSDFLMMHQQSKVRNKRSDSLDLIPACVPESVGLDIENILQNSFSTRHFLDKSNKVNCKSLVTIDKRSPLKFYGRFNSSWFIQSIFKILYYRKRNSQIKNQVLRRRNLPGVCQLRIFLQTCSLRTILMK